MSLSVKEKAKLVHLGGCLGCSKTCKYNDAIADPSIASENTAPYGCNSILTGFGLDEGSKDFNGVFVLNEGSVDAGHIN